MIKTNDSKNLLFNFWCHYFTSILISFKRPNQPHKAKRCGLFISKNGNSWSRHEIPAIIFHLSKSERSSAATILITNCKCYFTKTILNVMVLSCERERPKCKRDMKLTCNFTTQTVFVHEREGERERCTILI